MLDALAFKIFCLSSSPRNVKFKEHKRISSVCVRNVFCHTRCCGERRVWRQMSGLERGKAKGGCREEYHEELHNPYTPQILKGWSNHGGWGEWRIRHPWGEEWNLYIWKKKLDRLHDLRVNGNIILKESQRHGVEGSSSAWKGWKCPKPCFSE